jgi:hypothetical protein
MSETVMTNIASVNTAPAALPQTGRAELSRPVFGDQIKTPLMSDKLKPSEELNSGSVVTADEMSKNVDEFDEFGESEQQLPEKVENDASKKDISVITDEDVERIIEELQELEDLANGIVAPEGLTLEQAIKNDKEKPRLEVDYVAQIRRAIFITISAIMQYMFNPQKIYKGSEFLSSAPPDLQTGYEIEQDGHKDKSWDAVIKGIANTEGTSLDLMAIALSLNAENPPMKLKAEKQGKKLNKFPQRAGAVNRRAAASPARAKVAAAAK